MKLDLPELNSPATTSRKRPVSCSRASWNRRRSSAATSEPNRSRAVAKSLQQLLFPHPELLLSLGQNSSSRQQPADHGASGHGRQFSD